MIKKIMINRSEGNYTQIHNTVLDDERLDSTEITIILVLLRIHPSMTISHKELAKKVRLKSVNSLKTKLRHLKSLGYVQNPAKGDFVVCENPDSELSKIDTSQNSNVSNSDSSTIKNCYLEVSKTDTCQLSNFDSDNNINNINTISKKKNIREASFSSGSNSEILEVNQGSSKNLSLASSSQDSTSQKKDNEQFAEILENVNSREINSSSIVGQKSGDLLSDGKKSAAAKMEQRFKSKRSFSRNKPEWMQRLLEINWSPDEIEEFIEYRRTKLANSPYWLEQNKLKVNCFRGDAINCLNNEFYKPDGENIIQGHIDAYLDQKLQKQRASEAMVNATVEIKPRKLRSKAKGDAEAKSKVLARFGVTS